MTRIGIWISSTIIALLLLFSFHTSTGGTKALGVLASGVAGNTITGTAAGTRYGDVQVQIVVSSGKIVSATAVDYPTGGRDGEINSYAVPVLEKEAVAAQGASIDTVSGATVTSEGYKQSLQSALDQAHL